MLETQKFLRSGGSLEQLHLRYDVDVYACATLPLVAFNYTLFSPMDEAIPQECRGLILERDTWNLVCKSVPAFFDHDSPYVRPTQAAFEWEGARAYEKLDGALLCLYHYAGAWRAGLRTEADAHNFPACGPNSIPNTLSFYDLLLLTLSDMEYTWETFTAPLQPDIFYIFEICAPENRVGVIYPERRLTLIAALRRDTLEEVDIYALPYPVERALFHPVQHETEVWALLEAHPEPYECEGFVVCDRNFRRIKYKNPRFTQMMCANLMQTEKEFIRELQVVTAMDATLLTNTYIDTFGDTFRGFSAASTEGQPPTLLMRILNLAKQVNDEFYALAERDPNFNPEVSLWPGAMRAMKKGVTMSQFLDTVSEDEIIEALYRYEQRSF